MNNRTETMNEMPIACRPAALTVEERERSKVLRAGLATATLQTKALPDGYAFQVGARPDVFRSAAEWISLERRCCPFLAFELRWTQGDDAKPWLSVTGPEGTKEFLAAEMPELPHGT